MEHRLGHRVAGFEVLVRIEDQERRMVAVDVRDGRSLLEPFRVVAENLREPLAASNAVDAADRDRPANVAAPGASAQGPRRC